ncbi:MAG: peptide deformylase [Candidatus Pacebacteria bacterium]|jgi:peptide deformylase|nr:peptide deformylase [Candidatus Paceibacterota bacterium]
MTTIVQREHPVLREIAKAVPLKDIPTQEIKRVIARMCEALALQDDGVAIAAPQIGESLRIFVVSGKIFDKGFEKENYVRDPKNTHPDSVYINPEIIKLSREKKFMAEGCLSVRWLYGDVKRATRATVRAYDEHGNSFERGAGGLLAQIFQHEIDHLDGTLFIDKATNVHETKLDARSK